MAGLRAAARKRVVHTEPSSVLTSTTSEDYGSPALHLNTDPPPPLETHSPPSLQMQVLSPPELDGGPNLVAAIGMCPPLGSQQCPSTPLQSPRSPAYTWERTTPVNGKESGLFVLHLGPTPQASPMSRDPPNRIVNRKQLKAALHAKLSRARRREGGVTRVSPTPRSNLIGIDARTGRRGGRARNASSRPRQLDASARGQQKSAQTLQHAAETSAAVQPPGWLPPQIESQTRSPIVLRPRGGVRADDTVPFSIPGSTNPEAVEAVVPFQAMLQPSFGGPGDCTNVSAPVSDDSRFFQPGASPPQVLIQDPVHSPIEHTYLSKRAFQKTLCVRVSTETLNLDPSFVGDGNGVCGVVVSRFYHHVIGTPMFQVHFGDTIGARSVRVKDTALDVENALGGTARTLFPDNECTAGPSQPDASDDDPEWEAEFQDFVGEQEASDKDSDGDAPLFSEDPLQELGLYKNEEDVSSWPFEKVFADDQWQSQAHTLLQDTNNFSGPPPGPTSAPGGQPVEYFLRFWPPHALQLVVDETNRYALQPSQLNPALTNGRADWTPLDIEEFLAWFGILMLMGLKEFPHIRCYWNRRAFYNCPLISETMTRTRFEAIIRCLHLVNNEVLVTDRADPAYDKLAKVRWLCESFASMSQTLYNNKRILTVDEIMIPYKGRFCNIRQYMKAKPVKFGVKVWALANAKSRYVSNIIVYLGADNPRQEGDSVGEDVVLTAIAGLEGRGHVVITDNFFTSPRLFMELLRRGFWATGTCRKTRKGFPISLAGFSNIDQPERGHLALKMHRSRNIAAICWMDAKPVFLLSTACHPIGEDSFAGRWVGRERVDFPTSPILLQYQAGMRGVDVVDQQRQEYNTQLHSHKWWHRIFMFILDSQLLNSYILYASDRRALGLPVYSRHLWHYTVAEDLIRPRMAAGHIRGPIRNLAAGGLHFSSGHPLLRRRCVVCNRRTRRMCNGCSGMFQCEGACFRIVHTQPRYHAQLQGGAA